MIDTSAFQGKKAAYYTLGCKLNFSETSTFGQTLAQMGVLPAGKGEQADQHADDNRQQVLKVLFELFEKVVHRVDHAVINAHGHRHGPAGYAGDDIGDADHCTAQDIQKPLQH